MVTCCIIQCGARKNPNRPHLTMHRFPTNEVLRQKWLEVFGVGNIKPRLKVPRVCSLHFTESSFNKTLDVIRLRDDAVPSIHLVDTHQTHANASGDGDGVPGRCCRLCGGDNNLRYFGDTYVWEGVEERYDHLLNDCFGVKVTPSDCMICEWCVRALRTTGRFRALVHAAFDHPISDPSSSVATLKSCSCLKQNTEVPEKLEQGELPKKPVDLAKRREGRKRFLVCENKARRINISCDCCKQRYPMLINAADSYKIFTCSRCKKNGEIKGAVCKKCNIVMASNMMPGHLELHAKAEARRKFRDEERKRVPYQPRKLLVPEDSIKPRSHKFQCKQCPKKYALARHLAQHIRNAHGDSIKHFCSICNEDLETKEKLKEHLREHSGVHQCDECLLIFKNRRTLMAHSLKKHADSTTS